MFLDMDLFTWALLILSLVAVPIMGRREIRDLQRDLARGIQDARSRVYEKTMLFAWGQAILLVAIWLMMGRGLGEIGLVPAVEGWQWLWIAVSLVVAGFFVHQARQATSDPAELEKIRDQLGVLDAVVPHTERELRGFSKVSLSAGICEEILYRGLLLTSLAALIGTWPAVLASSLVFGLGHSYQGLAGVGRTGLVGLVLGTIVVLTGSLFTAILIHIVLDVVQGRMLYAAVNSAPQPGELALDAA